MAMASPRAVRRLVQAAVFGASALVIGLGLGRMGSDQWVLNGFPTIAAPHTDVWASQVTPVAASEAEWLRAHPGLQHAVAPGGSRIDLGPLDIVDVRALPAALDLDAGTAGAGKPKLILRAREASGRIVHLIVEAQPALPARASGL